MIFQHFDINGDGKLDRAEMAALIQAMNPRTSLTGEQTDAAVDEVFRAYADFLGVDDDPGINLDVLLLSCGDGTAELDRDFETLVLSLDAVDGGAAAPYSRAAADAIAQGISPASLASISSSLASSSFCSETDYSDLEDYEDPYLRMEIEEMASFRWLPPSFRRKPQRISRPESSEIDWQQLIPPDFRVASYADADLVEKRRNYWEATRQSSGYRFLTLLRPQSLFSPRNPPVAYAQVFGEDVSTKKRCCVVQARGLIIRWQENRSCWRYKRADAVLSETCGLEIGAEVGAASLSPSTDYVCVLVFDLVSGAFGLGLRGETQEASIYVGGRRVSRRTVRLQPPAPECPNGHDCAGEPRRRKDGWMEMALGEFSLGKKSGAAEPRRRKDPWMEMALGEFSLGKMGGGAAAECRNGHDGVFELRRRKDRWMEMWMEMWMEGTGGAAAAAVRVELRDVKAQPKGGLVVRGVEFTPAGFAYKRLRRVR